MPVQSTYDPLSPTPYQPVPTPEQPPAPTPNIPTPSPFEGQPGFQFQGHGNISHAGAVAGVLDNVLRGYVNGKAQGDAVKGLRLKKKSDDLNSSYKADADRLWTVTQKQISEKGAIDPNSDEYKQALSAVQGSWGALQDFRGSLLDDGKKKKPGKNGQERSPAEILSDPKSTPQEKAQALHGMTQKLGPPILGQIQNYQAQAKARAQNPEVQDADIRAKANLELSQLRTQKEPLTEAQQARVKQLEEYLTPTPKLGAGKEGMTRYSQGKDGWEEYQVNTSGDEIPGTRRPLSLAGANVKPFRAWTKDASGKFTSVLVDPKTNQKIPGSENQDIQPPAALAGHVTSHEYFWTDQNGDVHHYDYSTTSSPTATAAGTPGSTSPHTPSSPDHFTPRQHPSSVPSSATPSDKSILGHKGPISRAKIDQLDKDTQAQYQKASDQFNKLVDALNDPSLKLTQEQKDAAKKKYYDLLQEENHNIGKEHSDRMRDLGLHPAEDSSPKKDSLGIL